MGDDERATVKTLDAHRAFFSDTVTKHDGRLVDTARDSVLAVFDSVVEATTIAPTYSYGPTILADHRLYR